MGVYFKYLDRQVWPINGGGRFRGNDQTIKFAPNLEMLEPPWELFVFGINEDDTYEHTIYVEVDAEFPGGFFESILSRILPGGGPIALPGR